jgi:Xaa-Pro aminopeptidase
MGDEWPGIPHSVDWEHIGYDGELQENMVITLESCIGREDGIECVKLEEMVVVKKGGYQLLSTFPFEDKLMS